MNSEKNVKLTEENVNPGFGVGPDSTEEKEDQLPDASEESNASTDPTEPPESNTEEKEEESTEPIILPDGQNMVIVSHNNRLRDTLKTIYKLLGINEDISRFQNGSILLFKLQPELFFIDLIYSGELHLETEKEGPSESRKYYDTTKNSQGYVSFKKIEETDKTKLNIIYKYLNFIPYKNINLLILIHTQAPHNTKESSEKHMLFISDKTWNYFGPKYLDTVLTEAGVDQARETGKFIESKILKSNNEKLDISTFFGASNLYRAQQTLAIIINTLGISGVSIYVIPCINETGMGNENKSNKNATNINGITISWSYYKDKRRSNGSNTDCGKKGENVLYEILKAITTILITKKLTNINTNEIINRNQNFFRPRFGGNKTKKRKSKKVKRKSKKVKRRSRKVKRRSKRVKRSRKRI